MAEPFLAEIRIVGFNFAPRGWALCDGQILPINQNQSLFSLLGTTYGGDGQTSFALPDLRGRTPIHTGEGFQWGQKTGEETHSLTAAEIPQHKHTVQASTSNADAPVPNDNVLASTNNLYHDPTNQVILRLETVANAGMSQGHDNMQPYLTLNYVIALQGVFPSRN